MSNPFDNVIEFKYRAGTPQDPYVDITETRVIVDGQIQLVEIPVLLDHVNIENYVEVYTYNTYIIKNENEFYVDYKNGIVYFHVNKSGSQVVLNYKGRGTVLIHGSRVTLTASETYTSNNLHDFANEVSNSVKALINRVNDIITTPAEEISTQEIIDARDGQQMIGNRLNLLGDIKGTKQIVTFNANGDISKIEHKNSSNVIIRTDMFTYSGNTITEVRTLTLGGSITYKYNLDTWETEIL